VTPNTDYDFAAYLSSAQANNPARLLFVVDGTVIGYLSGSSTTGVWQHFFATWNSGAASSATLEIVNDNTVPGGNDFALDDIFFGPAIFSQTVATGTIINDDLSAVSVTVSPGSVVEDGSTSLVYTFTRSNTTSVAPALTVGFHVAGTATFNTDFTADGADTFTDNSGRVTFAEGSATASVTITPLADAVVEANETVLLTMASGPGYTIGTPNAATGTITNDDTAVPDDGGTDLETGTPQSSVQTVGNEEPQLDRDAAPASSSDDEPADSSSTDAAASSADEEGSAEMTPDVVDDAFADDYETWEA
jgi:hypothetical protein